MAPLKPSGPKEAPNKCPVPGRAPASLPPAIGPATTKAGLTPTSCPHCHSGGGNAIMGDYNRSGKRPVWERCPHTPPAQPGPWGAALPHKAGKEAENRFLFFHHVPNIYRPGRSGSFHPGHPERTGPRASPRPTWSISRLGQPALCKALGWA